ncbi:MAG: ATP-dependent helicase HrpB [Acidimicrobiia bacterium]
MHLPVEASIPELCQALRSSGSAVLSAPPGSGKTTVVPLRLLENGIPATGTIMMLEPRRLATRAAARRMASLLGEEVGQTVGYVTRDDRQVGPETRIEVVTEGILTRRLQRDPELPGVGLIIFDEFHERNLQTDLGLAFTLETRASIRPDLAVVVMSATLDADRVAGMLDAPVISSEARSHPVEMRWVPPKRSGRTEDHATAIVLRALEADVGDLLVFLPGMGEIERVARALTEAGAAAEIHRLHGSLPAADQDAAITPSTRRKVVLSTDIAESSLTVAGVSVVIDSGLARAPRFDVRTAMTRLQTVSISRASADQRAGRAGRTGPGVAYRLWSKVEHATRRAHIAPEITQVDLAGVVLELRAWGALDASTLSFLDPPAPKSLEEATRLLTVLGAIEEGRPGLTGLGEKMARLPVHPRLAHMITASGADAGLACVLASVLEDRDPMRGRSDELPVDIALRVSLVTGRSSHGAADRRGLERVRRTAADLARRVGAHIDDADPDRSGSLLALAFPDRLAIRRGTPGRFQLRTGTTAWVSSSDPLAPESFLVAADLDGKRKDSRIRLAAAIDTADVLERFSSEIEIGTTLIWSGNRLVSRWSSRLGGIVLEETEQRAEPGPDTVRAVLERVSAKPTLLQWTDHALSLRQRVEFLRRHDERWPDFSDRGLVASLADWLGPELTFVTGLDELAVIDLGRVLERRLGHAARAELERRAPAELTLDKTRRRLRIDYSAEAPAVAGKVQDFFGTATTPTVDGRPVVVTLLSPAGRPVQVTTDLAGFWTGSWQQVRKEMAGRYPKHHWPERP